ncbi:hypothetical protein DPMN_030975 [Dreissena polymorpha]|uniref:Uncharacterized protein n=1 Tax=Dreissena polymorpha TaxID=45954 RepID=A0A9D4RHL0_DREPO|nr:hypothetical protein DPMN_030975 [Dreissena polymorpha]
MFTSIFEDFFKGHQGIVASDWVLLCISQMVVGGNQNLQNVFFLVSHLENVTGE